MRKIGCFEGEIPEVTNDVYCDVIKAQDDKKLEHIEPENKIHHYDSNGYHYKANDNGQILYAGGDLRLGDGERNAYAQRMTGGEDRRENDDGGHLIANRFCGSGEADNLIPEDKSVNRGGYKSLENQWADALKAGKDVHVDIEPVYHGNSKRPDIIMGNSEIGDESGKRKDYFSMTNENLESDEFKLPDDDSTNVYPNALDYNHEKYAKELE